MPADASSWLLPELERQGLSRRDLLGFCGKVAGVLGMSSAFGVRIARALESAHKPVLVWLEFQDCAGNSESLLRASRPTVADVILDVISVDYHETIMAAAGHQSEQLLAQAVAEGGYICVVEGSIPAAEDGIYCTIGGRTALDIAREVCRGAAATIAVGTCASFGGLPAANPNPTGALSVDHAVPGLSTVINLSACPVNVENLTALLVYHLTTGRWPELDHLRRPLFAYGKLIHGNCERRAHFDAGQYVETWGDQAHRQGHCLYKMGCKGPVTSQNCPIVRWNEGTNWPIGCGHPCMGCAEPAFWDRMTPFYRHLTGIPGFSAATPLDKVGVGAVAAVGAAFAVHGVAKAIQGRPHKANAAPPPAPSKSEGEPS